jgi:nicotinate phosphoribosyltransferase
MRYGVPVFGTAAHSWTMAFPDEAIAFQKLHDLLGEDTAYLIDTYDTAEAARLAMRVGGPMGGVRLDSGDLVTETRKVRRILDAGGFPQAKIMVTNDLNELRIAELLAAGAPIDAFGVGTELATSADAPALSAVYKMVELRSGESNVYTAKYSADKVTLPAAKQVYRYPDRDVVALYNECNREFEGEPLLRPVLAEGKLIEPLPKLAESRARAVAAVSHLPEELRQLNVTVGRRVEVSDRLLALADSVRAAHQVAVS